MKKVGCFSGIVFLFMALWIGFSGARQVQGNGQIYQSFIPQVYKQAPIGPTVTPTPIPDPTTVPDPTNTPPVQLIDPSYIQRTTGAVWKVQMVQMVPCERASGNGIIFITTIDSVGKPLNGVNIMVKGEQGGLEITGIVTGDKAPGKTEVPVGRDAWDAWTFGDGRSDQAMNMREDLPNDPNCSGRFGNHFPYEVVFQRIN